MVGFDHGNELFIDLVEKFQPGASIAGREWTLVGTEGGYVLDGPNSLWSPTFPMGTANQSANGWLAYQCDTSLASSGWFWHGGARPRYNASEAVDLYGLQCIGAGAGLILNLPPSTRGLVEPEFVRWLAFGHWVAEMLMFRFLRMMFPGATGVTDFVACLGVFAWVFLRQGG